MEQKGFDYELWYQRQALKLAELLMEALHVAININHTDLWDVIEGKIRDLNLPKQKCRRCGAKMDYWDWAIRQGYCDKCIGEIGDEIEQ